MGHGTVNVRLRPIKLAFLVNPNDKKSLLKAIEINTFLWGGIYNPIIPTYKRIPSKWEDRRFKRPNLNAQSVISGYLDNFDPDYVVPMGECSDYSLDVGNREKIDDVSEILAPVEEQGTPKYGIGLFEVLNYFINRELKFQRRHPLEICIPRFGTRFRPFLASVFGTLPGNVDKIFWEHFARVLEAKKIDCSASNYGEFFDWQYVFFLRINGLELKHMSYRKKCIFILDANKPLDIMDYWNLRAIGWDVVPVFQQFALDFIEANLVPRSSNPTIFHDTTLKSRSVSEDEYQRFCDLLATYVSDDTYKTSNVVPSRPYPRIWADRVIRDADDVECCDLEADTAEHDLLTNQETIRFKTLDPKFINRFGGQGEARFANQIVLRLYGDTELFAEVLPEGGRKLATAISYSAFEWRLSRKGLVYLSRHSKWTVDLSLPQAEAIVTKWLELRGWRIELSPAGRISKQMIRQLGGKSGADILAQKGIIQLLGEMNSRNDILSKLHDEISNLQRLLKQDDFQSVTEDLEAFVKYLREIQPQLGGDKKSMSEADLWGKVEEIANQITPETTNQTERNRKQQIKRIKGRIHQQLIDATILQLGIEIQCPVCTQYSWYSVKSADYELECPKCLEQISFPSASKEVKWSYRTLGPFSLPGQAYGAYTVLLTLRFFSDSRLLGGATTPLMSFKAKRNEIELEADLALFFQASKFDDSQTQVIFVECKTFNDFKEKDADKMERLGEAFPGAVLVFATLKETLNEEEQTILRRVIIRSRKRRKSQRPFNHVLILTGTELFLESFWESHLDRYARAKELFELCDLTQQINLGMDSWHQWFDEQYRRSTSAMPTSWRTQDGTIVRSHS